MSALRLATGAGLLSCLLLSGHAQAAGLSIEQCVSANEAGQDAVRAGKLHDARATLTTCIAAECPLVLRQDCAQRLDDVTRIMPTIVFVVTDAAGNDLARVHVRSDGVLIAERLGGTAIEIDPGEHQLTFEASGFPSIEKSVLIRVNEKDRPIKVVMSPAQPAIVAAVPSPILAPGATPAAQPAPPPEQPHAAKRRAPWPYVSFGVAGAGLVAGAVFTGLWAQAKSDGNAACGVPMSCDPTTAGAWENKQRGLSIGAYASFGVAAAAAGLGLYLRLGHSANARPTGSAVVDSLARGVELAF